MTLREKRERAKQYRGPNTTRKSTFVKCKICNEQITTVGMYRHIRYTHKMNYLDYISTHGEFRPKYIDYQIRASQNNFKCEMCNEKLSSAVHLGHHVHKAHNLTGPDYALQYVFKGTPPTCKCGCGKPVLILKCPPYKREYIFGHWPTPNLKDYLTPKIRKKMSQKAIERVMRNKLSFNISSKSSSEFLDKLEQLFGVKIQREFQINSKFYDGKWKRHIFEVDGAYWHKNGNGRDKYKTRLARRHGFRVHRFVVNRVGEIQEKLDKYKNKLDVIFNRTK